MGKILSQDTGKNPLSTKGLVALGCGLLCCASLSWFLFSRHRKRSKRDSSPKKVLETLH